MKLMPNKVWQKKVHVSWQDMHNENTSMSVALFSRESSGKNLLVTSGEPGDLYDLYEPDDLYKGHRLKFAPGSSTTA